MIHDLDDSAVLTLLVAAFGKAIEPPDASDRKKVNHRRRSVTWVESLAERFREYMGSTLARRLGKQFHFGMVVENHRDKKLAQIDVSYVRWDDIKHRFGVA